MEQNKLELDYTKIDKEENITIPDNIEELTIKNVYKLVKISNIKQIKKINIIHCGSVILHLFYTNTNINEVTLIVNNLTIKQLLNLISNKNISIINISFYSKYNDKVKQNNTFKNIILDYIKSKQIDILYNGIKYTYNNTEINNSNTIINEEKKDIFSIDNIDSKIVKVKTINSINIDSINEIKYLYITNCLNPNIIHRINKHFNLYYLRFNTKSIINSEELQNIKYLCIDSKYNNPLLIENDILNEYLEINTTNKKSFESIIYSLNELLRYKEQIKVKNIIFDFSFITFNKYIKYSLSIDFKNIIPTDIINTITLNEELLNLIFIKLIINDKQFNTNSIFNITNLYNKDFKPLYLSFKTFIKTFNCIKFLDDIKDKTLEQIQDIYIKYNCDKFTEQILNEMLIISKKYKLKIFSFELLPRTIKLNNEQINILVPIITNDKSYNIFNYVLNEYINLTDKILEDNNSIPMKISIYNVYINDLDSKINKVLNEQYDILLNLIPNTFNDITFIRK